MDVKKETVEREVTTTVKEDAFVITLSKDEANAIMAIVGTIGGAAKGKNVRTVTDKLYEALSQAGVSYWTDEVRAYMKTLYPARVGNK